ncbi:aspartate/glutamate racemase family protein [Subtercola boreus]|uniref:Hydantoin racemase n=1 Tax=Subtercola boreus TaxID=120213 RepID=A0A3E0W6U3_9MICO|nr:aspartate/glutamate racemase family protein [Subtercola boreus]RFA18166.1 hydantoin racemase [Subtercola boreus]RFA18548.1 hydantoin racemase [Subtercola boreus]RFA25076.1 hydantoin racemase [Subtercola boreus]
MLIAIVNPNTTASMTDAVVEAASAIARPDTELLAVTAPTGVPSIESHIDEVHGSAAVLAEVERLEAAESAAARPDAYVIACFGDTGLPGAREAATGPVVGMTEAALMTAALLAHRFSIITMPARTIEQSDRVVRTLGLGHRATVRAVDEPVSEVTSGSLHLLDLFVAEGRRAIADDRAEAIILGCAGLADLVAPLASALGVPVIEGVSAAVTLAEGLVAQGLTTSRALTWGRPGEVRS